MYCIFPVLKSLACGRQSRCLGWTYKLPGGEEFSIELSPLSVGFPQRRPLNLIKRPTPIYKLPRGAIYKPPCVQLINSPFFAIHQVFALLSQGKLEQVGTNPENKERKSEHIGRERGNRNKSGWGEPLLPTPNWWRRPREQRRHIKI